MNLIIDSGATKANWTLAHQQEIQLQVHTQGLHPLLMPNETLRALSEEARRRGISSASNIFYYGTGCKVESSRQRLRIILQQVFPKANRVEVDTDLMGAAQALCQRAPGVACILGTGSNSCLFDGEKITQNNGGYGFILGDEGSGAAIGKDLMADFLNKQIPGHLREQLIEKYKLTSAEIIESTYRRPAPSRYLASFAPFLLENIEEDYIHNLVKKQFVAFLKKYILTYDHVREIPVHFTGSIAWYFRSYVELALDQFHLQKGIFLPEPMEGLVQFHGA